MAAKLKIEKRGDEIKKKSSPLKLVSQSQPNFAELGSHLGWKSGSPDTILEGGHSRIIPQKFGCNWPSGF
jgi:hypothetical protein